MSAVRPFRAGGGSWLRLRLRRHRAALVLCAASAASALLLKHLVFPILSLNNDEAIYRLQADAMAHGHLFPPAPHLAAAFRPWLAAISGDHYVMKYSLVLPAIMAMSHLLSGGYDLYLAGVAAGVVGMAYLLALEVLKDRREALVGAVIVATSPIVLLHGALLLPYLPTLLLLETFAWALLRGMRQGRASLLIVSSIALGLAFNVRPYDATLFGLPMVALAVWRRPGVRAAVAFLVPSAVALVAFLTINAVITGSPLRPPFSFLEPADTFGFGERRLYPSEMLHTFSIFEAVDGFIAHGALLLIWLCGGPVIVALAVAGWNHLHGREARVLGLAALLVPAGYFVFWGPWNATIQWGGARYLGPFYFLVVLMPGSLFAARALGAVARRRRIAASAIAGVMAVATVAVSVVVVGHHLRFTHEQQAVAGLADQAGSGPRLVIAQLVAPYLLHPVAAVGNDASMSRDPLYAVDRGTFNLDLVSEHRNRRPLLLAVDGDFTYKRGVTGRLRALRRVSAPQIVGEVMVRLPRGSWTAELELEAFGRARRYRLPYNSGTHAERFTIDTSGARVAGSEPYADYTPHRRTLEMRAARDTLVSYGEGLTATLYLARSGADFLPQPRARDRGALRRGGGVVEALLPIGETWSTPGARPKTIEISLTPN